jgi:hypothetical protein
METINFNEMGFQMENLVRIYMVFGEDTFTYEEANNIASFSPNIIRFYRDNDWLVRVDQDDGTTLWKLTYMGARMTEIYMELKAEKEIQNKNQTLF